MGGREGRAHTRPRATESVEGEGVNMGGRGGERTCRRERREEAAIWEGEGRECAKKLRPYRAFGSSP